MDLKFPLNYIAITTKYKSTHKAIDLGWSKNYGGKNVDVYACGDGVVTSIRDGKNNTLIPHESGNYVTIKYINGFESRVCHLQKGSIKVKKGDKVTNETVVGKMGNSGYCGINKGNHVHFILWKNNKRVNPLNYVYVFPDQIVGKDTKKENHLLYYDNITVYIEITAKSGIWCRKGAGFKYSKYKAIPSGMKCKLVNKDVKRANGYDWWKIIYDHESVYIPYNKDWVKEL